MEPTFDAPLRSIERRAVVFLATAIVACATSASRDTTPIARAIASAAVPAVAALPDAAMAPSLDAGAAKLSPLDASSELTPLDVPGFRRAYVSVPLGATQARPVVLALHGNFDRPEWQCEVWRAATKGHPFVLCPRGIPRGDAPPSLDRWTYGKGAAVNREIDAALAALHERYGDYVDPGPVLYVGFSLGAILGVGIVSRDPERFPRAVLIEGGQSGWSATRVRAFATAGSHRVLFACGQRSCRSDAKGTLATLTRAGIDTRIVYGGEVGHTYDGPVAAEITRSLPWLVGDDPRWSASIE